MTTLTEGFGGQLMLVAVVAIGACALAYQLRHLRLPFGLEAAPVILALGSALAIAVVTLTPQAGSRVAGSVQLVPLETIRGYKWRGGLHDLVIYAVGNIALFVPLGFFLYLSLRPVLRELTLPGAAVLGSGISFAVEIMQLPIWSRSSDIDDWMTNSAGAAGGAVLAAVAVALHRRLGPELRSRSRQPEPGRQYSYRYAHPDAPLDPGPDPGPAPGPRGQGVGFRAS